MSTPPFSKPIPREDAVSDSSHVAAQAERGVRVAAYLLFSPDTAGEAVLSHLAEWLDGIAPGHTFVGVYWDDRDVSDPSAPRADYERLLSDCREGKIDRVVCRSVPDFNADMSGFVDALRFLKECKVTIFFEEEGLDTADPSAEEILMGLDAYRREEERGRRETRRQAVRRRYRSGVSANQAVYGYRCVEGEEACGVPDGGCSRRRLVVDEDEAQVVRRIFQLAADGVPCGEVARILNREGIPAPGSRRKGRRETAAEGADRGWTAQQIRRMLKRERYAGNVGESPQIPVAEPYPAIVSRELFEAAQGAGISRSTAGSGRGRGKEPPPFSGKIICEACGSFFHITNRAVSPVWVCPTSRLNNGRAVCGMRSIHEKELVAVLKAALRIRLGGREPVTPMSNGSFADLEELLERYDGRDRREREEFGRRIRQVTGERESLESAAHRTQARWNAQKVRAEVLGEEEPGEESAASLEAELARMERDRAVLAGREKELQDEIRDRETYWSELQRGEEGRRRTLEWMRTLNGAEDFEKGLDGRRLASLILSAVVGRDHVTVRWFDDTETRI